MEKILRQINELMEKANTEISELWDDLTNKKEQAIWDKYNPNISKLEEKLEKAQDDLSKEEEDKYKKQEEDNKAKLEKDEAKVIKKEKVLKSK